MLGKQMRYYLHVAAVLALYILLAACCLAGLSLLVFGLCVVVPILGYVFFDHIGGNNLAIFLTSFIVLIAISGITLGAYRLMRFKAPPGHILNPLPPVDFSAMPAKEVLVRASSADATGAQLLRGTDKMASGSADSLLRISLKEALPAQAVASPGFFQRLIREPPAILKRRWRLMLILSVGCCLSLLFCLYSLYLSAREHQENNRLLFIAVREDDPQAVPALLRKGADPNTTSRIQFINEGFSLDESETFDSADPALMIAARNGDLAIATILLSAGADVNKKNKEGATTLTEAAEQNNVPMAKLLLAHGADLYTHYNGIHALMKAVSKGYPAMTRLLLDNGVNINDKNDLGQTALLKLADHWQDLKDTGRKQESRDIFYLLLKRGIDINAKDIEGQTALRLAQQHDYLDLVALLKQAGAREGSFPR